MRRPVVLATTMLLLASTMAAPMILAGAADTHGPGCDTPAAVHPGATAERANTSKSNIPAWPRIGRGYDDAAQPARMSASRVARSLAPQTGTSDDCDDGDHIVLGLEAYGLRETAARVGGRHLLNDPNWRYTFLPSAWDVRVTEDGIHEIAYGVAPSAAETLLGPTPVGDLKMVTAIIGDSEGKFFNSGTIEIGALLTVMWVRRRRERVGVRGAV